MVAFTQGNSMFVLTLSINDPEDAGYFTNKTLNKLHGYLQHHSVKMGIFFNTRFIKIYAHKKNELDDLQQNQAVSYDIKRHIFEADISAVTETHIKVFKRMRDTVASPKKKANQRIAYYKKKYKLDEEILEELKKECLYHYEQKQKKRRYFVIKNQEKRFTIWLEIRKINVSDFIDTSFNSYGLLSEN